MTAPLTRTSMSDLRITLINAHDDLVAAQGLLNQVSHQLGDYMDQDTARRFVAAYQHIGTSARELNGLIGRRYDENQ
jgi:hypothetical protein